MSEISRENIFGKLNTLTYKALEGGTVYCKMKGNPYVELVHWFNQIMQLQDSDLHHITRYYDIDLARLIRDVTDRLEQLPGGHTTITDFSQQMEDTVEQAWLYASLMYKDSKVRTAYIILSMLKTKNLKPILFAISSEFKNIDIDELTDNLHQIVKASPEDSLSAKDGTSIGGSAPGDSSNAIAPAQMGKQEALKQFAIDLTEQARNGEIDPIVGRDEEIRQITDILMRRRQNNPILTGEAGVGKTAVLEGFALRIVAGDVPPPLKDVSLLSLDIGLLQAGASMKGEFEERLKKVIDEVQLSEKPIILFIDEAHTLIGAGGASGTGDAANLLKPALARGTLRTIAATTWAEYKKYIEKDPALTRRFQIVKIEEPDEAKGILMMRGIASSLEHHHKVQILDEAIEASVNLSHRYIPARQLPDKSVSLLDTACARVAISQHSIPAVVDDCRRRIEALETERKVIQREQSIGINIKDRLENNTQSLEQENLQLVEFEKRWNTEKDLVKDILSLRAKLRDLETQAMEKEISASDSEVDEVAPDTELNASEIAVEENVIEKNISESDTDSELDKLSREELLEKLYPLQDKLAEHQKESPLILPSVDAQAVASVVADWTGIPVGKMVKNEIEAILTLSDTINERVIGQKHGLDMIAKRIQTSKAGLDNPSKPIGVFMLAGPSGVGKTETALALAEALYGGEHNVITINMSEFQEAHTVSTLKGAPPGYVGYGEGGILTEAVRRKPYSVVLLDEVEKAHPDVHEIFFQVFDKGVMEDGEGRVIDFKNTLILLTSNVGSDVIMDACADESNKPDSETLSKALRKPLLEVFPAALLGRIVTIPYYPLNTDMIAKITELQLNRIVKRMMDNQKIELSYDDEVIQLISDRCIELESGGRMIDAILTNSVLPVISQTLLTKMMNGEETQQIKIAVNKSEFEYNFS